jgi:hypothetical protein
MENNGEQAGGFRTRPRPFIGLTEAIAWLVVRDEQAAQGVEAVMSDDGFSKVARWIEFSQEWQERGLVDFTAAFRELSELAAVGDLSGLGRNGARGFEPIPAVDWIEAELDYGSEPDAFKPSGSPGWIFGTVWTHIRFKRADVYRIWPAQPASSEAAPFCKAAWEAECERVAMQLDTEEIAKREVRIHHITSRWNPVLGAPPQKKNITGRMKGQPKGRPHLQ